MLLSAHLRLEMGNMRRNALSACLLALAFCIWPGSQAFACELSSARPVVTVTTIETPVRYDLTRSVEQLNGMDIDTVSPYPSNYHTNVGGLMSGQVAVEHKIAFNHETLGDRSCVSVDAVELVISISPKIFIASDFQDQTCWFKEIFAHESKHVDADRKLISTHKGRFVDGVNMTFMQPRDFSSGWIEASDENAAETEITANIEDTIRVLFKQMLEERQQKQQDIDSLHEYNRISRACHQSS